MLLVCVELDKYHHNMLKQLSERLHTKMTTQVLVYERPSPSYENIRDIPEAHET